MTDGEFTSNIPNASSNNVEDDLAEIRENFEYQERSFFLLAQLMRNGYYVEFSYTGDKLTGITVKDSTDATKGTAVLTYTGDELTEEAWTINGKTLTYTYIYSSGKMNKIELNIT